MNLRIQIIFLIILTVGEGLFAQHFYRSVADKDSFAYVTMDDKILILKRDQANELQYVKSIPFKMTHRQDKFNTELIIDNYLLVTSKDSVVLFSISDPENPVELDRIKISNIFSLYEFGPLFIVLNNNSQIVVAIENDSLVIKNIGSGGINSNNPYFPEWGFGPYTYPYKIGYFTYKYDINTHQFNVIDTMKYCDQCSSYGSLAIPGDTTFFYGAIGCCLGSGWIDWYKYYINNNTVIQGPKLCQQSSSWVLLHIQGYTLKKYYGWSIVGPLWFNSNDICTKYPFTIPVHPQDYPIAIDSLMYRIGNQGFYYQYQITNNYLVFHQFHLPVSVENENSSTPFKFKLEQNYPNPFNPTTKISWRSPISSWQTLKIYDMLGNEVAILVNEYRPAGNYEVEFSGNDLPSGIYFYQLKSGSFIQTKKMILLK